MALFEKFKRNMELIIGIVTHKSILCISLEIFHILITLQDSYFVLLELKSLANEFNYYVLSYYQS